jgi:kumamolisin
MPAARARLVPLPGSEHPRRAETIPLGPVDPDRVIDVVLVLRERQDTPALPGQDYFVRTPAREREVLSDDEFAARHGAHPDEIDQVEAFARSGELEVVESHVARRTVHLRGTTRRLDAAFGIVLTLYRTAEGTHRGYDGPVQVPADLAQIVVAVFGLDDRPLASRATAGAALDPALTLSALTPVDVARLYGFPAPKTMSAQTVGLFEFGGGYLTNSAGQATDADTFNESLGLPDPTVLPPVSILGGSNHPYDSPGHLDGDSIEVTLDIEVAASVAVGADVATYFISTNADIGWLMAVTAALFPLPGQPRPTALSISWAWDEADWPAAQLNAMSGYFQTAATRHVTVFAASGDKGAQGNQNNTDGLSHVVYPAGDPWITAVGGSVIGDVDGDNFAERTWTPSGGGVSIRFPLPSWQVGAGVPKSINDGTTVGRGVPDIAGYANGYTIFVGGADLGGIGGTSEASPLYAAMVAVLNGWLGYDLGYLNPLLYTLGKNGTFDIFNDIDDGASNAHTFTEVPPSPPITITSPGYVSGPGWDAVTGWGSIHATRLYAWLAQLPLVATAIQADFGPCCFGSWKDTVLTVDNSGFGDLTITGITSSNGAFEVPTVSSYPLVLEEGDALDLIVRFRPSGAGNESSTLTITSNDPSGPHAVLLSGVGQRPRLALVTSPGGTFPPTCVGSFSDQAIVLNNASDCPLTVEHMATSNPVFAVPAVAAFPLVIGPGATLPVPVRFSPTARGAVTGTLTVTADDPTGTHTVELRGEAPSPQLTVTGSTHFGGVRAGTEEQRTVILVNTGDCVLTVASVDLHHDDRAFRLLDRPFPARILPGSQLDVVVEYHAVERESRACRMVITSDDPEHPVLGLELLAHTVWDCCPEPRCQPDPCSCPPPCGCRP